MVNLLWLLYNISNVLSCKNFTQLKDKEKKINISISASFDSTNTHTSSSSPLPTHRDKRVLPVFLGRVMVACFNLVHTFCGKY